MRNIRREKGAITIITVVTILFIVSFLISTYIIIANKVKNQKQMIEETTEIYESKETMEDVYNSYFNKGNIIPIYTAEELLKIGKEENNVNINGKYYNFNNKEDTIYVLMNDIKFKASDYADKITDGYWLPIGNNQKLKAKFEGQNHKIEVIYDDNTREYTYSNRYADIGKWKLSENGNTVICGGLILNIGDYVNYTYDTVEKAYDLPTTITGYTEDKIVNQTTNAKWRVLGVDSNGCLTLISGNPISNSTVGLGDAKGYNNGVYILNDICAEQYSNKELGITARSLNIEDVEGGFSKIGETARDSYYVSSADIHYGESYTFTAHYLLNYPVIYAEENGSGIGVTKDKVSAKLKRDGIGVSDSYYNENQLITKPEETESKKAGDKEGEEKALTCTETYYQFNSTPQEYCKNSTFYEMIFGTKTAYWLASRYVLAPSSRCQLWFVLYKSNRHS